MSAATVSVVIPHFGDPAPTRRLVAALQAQEPAAPHEVVVVDDCSPEPLGEIPGATVVRRDRNGGFGSACNTGADTATGELLLFLNSDVEVAPTFVADLVAASAPWQPAVTGPALLDADGRVIDVGRAFPTARHLGAEWVSALHRFEGSTLWQRAVGVDPSIGLGDLTPVDWLVGAALLVPRPVFAAVGGFDEGFFMNAEEVDLQRRLRDRGIPSVLVGTVTVRHPGGGSSDPERNAQWLVDARLRYADKWGGRGRLVLALDAATGVNVLTNTVRRAAGRDVHPLRNARRELALVHRRLR